MCDPARDPIGQGGGAGGADNGRQIGDAVGQAGALGQAGAVALLIDCHARHARRIVAFGMGRL